MQTDTRPKRPIWVWIIFVATVIWFFWTGLLLFLIFSGLVPLTPDQKAHISNTSAGWVISAFLILLQMIGVTGLFLLRKWAVTMLISTLVLNIVNGLWYTVSKGLPAAPEGGLNPGISMGIGWAIMGAICLYSWRLKVKGMLR